MARVALESQLVDELLSPDEFFGRQNVAEERPSGAPFEGYDFRSYLTNHRKPTLRRGRYLGVVILEGNILMDAPQGSAIGARQTVRLLRNLRQDENVAGLLLRINSPGGSSFASELIRRELELFQLSDRPVYASFADTAASGGYWIASTADRIYAEPTTITGSIGAFSIIPTFTRSLDELGINSDGVGTTNLTGGLSPVLGVNDGMRSVLEQSIRHTYRQFTTLVARGRELSMQDVEAVADGRIFLGTSAVQQGLADELGSLEAAQTALLDELGLSDDAVRRLVPGSENQLQLLRSFLASSLANDAVALTGLNATEISRTAAPWVAMLKSLSRFDDPKHSYALCLSCTAR